MGAVPAAPLDPLSEDPRLLSSAVPLYRVLVRSCLSRTASCGLCGGVLGLWGAGELGAPRQTGSAAWLRPPVQQSSKQVRALRGCSALPPASAHQASW